MCKLDDLLLAYRRYVQWELGVTAMYALAMVAGLRYMYAEETIAIVVFVLSVVLSVIFRFVMMPIAARDFVSLLDPQ